jgi:hypothetical protein
LSGSEHHNSWLSPTESRRGCLSVPDGRGELNIEVTAFAESGAQCSASIEVCRTDDDIVSGGLSPCRHSPITDLNVPPRDRIWIVVIKYILNDPHWPNETSVVPAPRKFAGSPVRSSPVRQIAVRQIASSQVRKFANSQVRIFASSRR